MTSMQAIRVHRFGGVDELSLERSARPEPGPDDVLVRVRAAGVNRIDAAARAGFMQGELPLELPFIPGCDISGKVVAPGANVTAFGAGDEVYAMIGLLGGGYAEYAAVPARLLAAKPRSVGHTVAAGVPLAALTAWQALFEAGQLIAGQRVLIHAAAGGVGHIAVQLAKRHGAYVIGTASAANAGFVAELGADEVLDYRAQRFEDRVRDVDLVVVGLFDDTEARSYGVVRRGGRLVALVGPVESPATDRDLTRTRLFVRPDAEQLGRIAALIDAHRLHIAVQLILPLHDAPGAHATLEAGHTRGKLVLEIPA